MIDEPTQARKISKAMAEAGAQEIDDWFPKHNSKEVNARRVYWAMERVRLEEEEAAGAAPSTGKKLRT